MIIQYPNIKNIQISDPIPLLPNSRQETLNSKYFYGKLSVEGKGRVDVIYPYVELDIKCIKNVNFLYYTYIALIAKGEHFLGWYLNGERLFNSDILILTEKRFSSIENFCAKFL